MITIKENICLVFISVIPVIIYSLGFYEYKFTINIKTYPYQYFYVGTLLSDILQISNKSSQVVSILFTVLYIVFILKVINRNYSEKGKWFYMSNLELEEIEDAKLKLKINEILLLNSLDE